MILRVPRSRIRGSRGRITPLVLLLRPAFVAICLTSFGSAFLSGSRATQRPSAAFFAAETPDFEDEGSLRDVLLQQQEQINKLLAAVGNQSSETTSIALAPCRVMIFIDGTWLYYSLYERANRGCPIVAKFGADWHLRYSIDWNKFTEAVASSLPDTMSGRPFEVMRSSVFTSYRPDTRHDSLRYKMFEDMKDVNFDMHMLLTVGKNEKCVDIQLAVEMLHYATVPGAYDVALIVTGDKDYIPAMKRSRQKGRTVGLVSMRTGCNRALYETDGIKDFDVVWLENMLDDFIVPKSSNSSLQFSSQFFTKVISDFIAASGFDHISSRDLGRYLKSMKVGNGNSSDLLTELKRGYGGINKFLGMSDFEIVYSAHNATEADFAYLIKYTGPNEIHAPESGWSDAEVEHWEKDANRRLEKDKFADTKSRLKNFVEADSSAESLPDLSEDKLAEMTVNELKSILKERGLRVTGKKKELIDRVKESQSTTSSHIVPLLSEYLTASGGRAAMRSVGTYLSLNKASCSGHQNALEEIKNCYGTLRSFVERHNGNFKWHNDREGMGWILLKKRR